MSTETQRLFFAIRMSDALIHCIHSRITPLKSALKGKWSLPADYHITLKFLGMVSPAQRDTLITVGETVSATAAPFTLSLNELGCFERLRGESILWLGIADGLSPLTQLANSLEVETTRQNFAPENHPYRPHMTLARVPKSQLAALQQELKKDFHLSCPKMQVTTMELMESRRIGDAETPMYHCIRKFALGPG